MRKTAVLLAALAGCAAIDHQPVEGWPALEIVEHYVPADEMMQRCRKYAGFGALPLGCAEFNLAARRCDIWLSESFAPRALLEHERLHCRGYDHVGATAMRDLLARYQAASGASRTASSPATQGSE